MALTGLTFVFGFAYPWLWVLTAIFGLAAVSEVNRNYRV